MATPKVQTAPRTRRLRVPSDQEMQLMGMLWSYARVREIGRRHGLDAIVVPREFRVAKAPDQRPRSRDQIEAEIRRKIAMVMAMRDRQVTARQRARAKANGAAI